MHLIVNTKWHMIVWRPARSRWPTIVTVHPALESWSAGEPFGCPVSDSPPLIHPSVLASITQEGIQRRNTFIHMILNIVTKATSGSHEVSFDTSPDCSSSYTSCECVTLYSLWSCSFFFAFPPHFFSSICLMSWPSTPFGNLGSHLNHLAPLR